MEFESTSTNMPIRKYFKLMKGAKSCDYERLKELIKTNIPDLYQKLALDAFNPYGWQSKQTKTHYILCWSAIQFFIKK